MTGFYYFAAFLALAVGLAHSVLGERYILIRLFRRPDLPRLFGNAEFTIRTLRFAWHITTVAWWGFGAVLVLLAKRSVTQPAVSAVLAATFLATGVITLVVSRGRHLAWLPFFLIGGVCFYGAVL